MSPFPEDMLQLYVEEEEEEGDERRTVRIGSGRSPSKEKGKEVLEVIKRESEAKSQKILKVEKELQAKQKGLAFLTDQFKQLKQQGKDRVSVANSQVRNVLLQIECNVHVHI